MSDNHDEHENTCDHCDDDTTESNKLTKIFNPSVALRTLTPISGMLLFLGFVSSFSLQPEFVSVFYFISLIAGSVFVVRSAVRGLIKQRFLNISFLVVIAALGATLYR
jgi:cation transport ATPase